MQNVLIAFDSKELCFIMSKMLKDLGFQPFFTDKYDEVQGLNDKYQPAVFFSDWTLEGKDISQLVSALAPTPLRICVSSDNNPQMIQKALDLGADEYIMKPFDNDILQSKLSVLGVL